jgi:hypothetical protein
MAKKTTPAGAGSKAAKAAPTTGRARPSALVDTRVIYCGDNLEQIPRDLKPWGVSTSTITIQKPT